MNNLLSEIDKEFEDKFGKAGPDRNSDSIGRSAGCDDCVENIELREEHLAFLHQAVKKAYEEGLLMAYSSALECALDQGRCLGEEGIAKLLSELNKE